MEEREPVGILIGLQGGRVHQAADREMRQNQPTELLAHEVWSLAAQDDAGAAQMGLEFIKRGFKPPPLERLKSHSC